MRYITIAFFAGFLLLIQCKKKTDKSSEGVQTEKDLIAEKNRAYKNFFQKIQEEEPYLGFFAAEQKCLNNLDVAYEKARYDFFMGIRLCTDDPYEYINPFISFCEENNYIVEGNNEEWKRKLSILAYEMYANRPMFEFTSTNVKHIPDLVFAEYPNKILKLDLFLPEKPVDSPVPCVVCIHGGGWRVNKKIWFAPCAAYLADKGMAAITIDYRLMPAVRMIDCIHDVKAAVRWVRANADQYGIDSNRIGALGGSAGAHLAAMLSTTSDVPELEGDGGHSNYSSSIRAGVGFATPAFKIDPSNIERLHRFNMSPEDLKFVSPYENISFNSSPFYFIHGMADEVVNPQDSENMYNKFIEVGSYAELKWIQDGEHVFYDGEMAMELAADFFLRQFNLK